MLSELQPMGLVDAAKALDIAPAELIRIMVTSQIDVESLKFTPERLESVRSAGQLENWWEAADGVPADTNPLRGRVRGAAQFLLERQLIGDKHARLDNLWRGLRANEQQLVERAVGVMVQEGLLQTFATTSGVRVSVNPSSVGALEKLVKSSKASPSLAALW